MGDGREAQGAGDLCIIVADSHCYMALLHGRNHHNIVKQFSSY